MSIYNFPFLLQKDVFQGVGFSGFRFFRIHVFHGPGFNGPGLSGFKFLWVQIFQGPDFKVQIFQGLGPGFRSSNLVQLLIFLQFRVNPFQVPIGCPKKDFEFSEALVLSFWKKYTFLYKNQKKIDEVQCYYYYYHYYYYIDLTQ